jgi:nucleoside-diphosphate-sugar epimerase
MFDKPIIVTGGAGAIGSRLVGELLRRGASGGKLTRSSRVVVVDDMSSGYEWLLPPNIMVFRKGIAGDLADGGTWNIEHPTVFHLAAFFANQNSVDHPQADLVTNGSGTLSVLEWAEKWNARRVIYTSAGCSIAGHDLPGPIREDAPVSLHLDTPYQITKALGEFYCNYFHARGLPTVRCRLFNSYGPGEVPGKYRNVIPNFIWEALHDRPLKITGTGLESRDFVYVGDIVDGLIRAAEAPEAVGRAINLGTGTRTTIGDLARSIIEITGSKSTIEYAPRRTWDKATRREADPSLAECILGWKAVTPLHVGLEETVRWMRDHSAQIAKSVGA